MTADLRQYAEVGKPVDCFRVIDAHAHLGTLRGYEDDTPAERIAKMDRAGVDVAVMSSILAINGDIAAGNDAVREAIDEFPGRLAGYVHVSANYPDTVESELRRCLGRPGFVGIKLYQNGIAFDDPAFEPVWAVAAERGCPILSHTWSGNLTGLDEIAVKHPGVKVILGHSGSGLNYQAYVRAAASAPNIYLDLTGSRDFAGLIEHFVTEVGADRIVWGSDEPLFSIGQQMSRVLFARISDAEKKAILCDTPGKLFGLSE